MRATSFRPTEPWANYLRSLLIISGVDAFVPLTTQAGFHLPQTRSVALLCALNDDGRNHKVEPLFMSTHDGDARYWLRRWAASIVDKVTIIFTFASGYSESDTG